MKNSKTKNLTGFLETKVLVVIIVAVLAVAVGLGVYLTSSNDSVNNVETPTDVDSEVTQPTDPDSVDVNGQNLSLGGIVQRLADELSVPENAFVYRLTDGSQAYYRAQKTFVSRPGEIVTGVSENIIGIGYVLDNTGRLIIQADMNDFRTDNSNRDSDILPLFSDKTIRFVANLADLGIESGQPFELNVPGSLTVSGVTNEVTFAVSGELTSDGLNATGSTRIKMSDFGIESPSLLGVFSVADEIEIGFTAVGESL